MSAIIEERKSGIIPLSERVPPQWTQDEAIAYECACETITNLMAIKSGQIYREEKKENPDGKLIAKLEEESSRLHRERVELQLKDHVNVERICVEYGAIIRAHRMDK